MKLERIGWNPLSWPLKATEKIKATITESVSFRPSWIINGIRTLEVRRHKAQCGNFRIFLLLRFYVYSLKDLKCQKLQNSYEFSNRLSYTFSRKKWRKTEILTTRAGISILARVVCHHPGGNSILARVVSKEREFLPSNLLLKIVRISFLGFEIVRI